MNPMKTKQLVLAIWLLLGGIVAQIAFSLIRPAPLPMMASWVNNPKSLQEAKDSSDEIVTGRVTRVRRGDDIVTEIPGMPGGRDAIPVEVVTIKVDKQLKGGGKKETIEVFHTGLSKGNHPSDRGDKPPEPPPPDAKKPAREVDKSRSEARPILLMDDPDYQAGEQYVLFLRPGPKVTAEGAAVETKRVLSPEGRYKVKQDGKLEPASRRADWVQKYKDKDVREFEAEVEKK
jgi:hypothetical protein